MPTLIDYICFGTGIIALLLGFNSLVFLTLGALKYKNIYLKRFWITYLATTVMLISYVVQFFINDFTPYTIGINSVITPICMSFIILNLSLLVTGLLYEECPGWVKASIWLFSAFPVFIIPLFYLLPNQYMSLLSSITSLEFYIMLGLNCVTFLIGFNRLDNSYKKLTKTFTLVLVSFVLVFMVQLLFDLDINPFPLFYLLWSILLITYFWKNIFVVSINKLSSASFIEQYHITEREKDIMDLIVLGKTNKAIGEQLYISEKTVKNHIYNLYKKLGINSRFELMGLYNKNSSSV
ncbi:MAG TPA: response regulator transcription factor [Clostridia bacterium]|nr:response regulator transcription factor [Clostridia bacterium]